MKFAWRLHRFCVWRAVSSLAPSESASTWRKAQLFSSLSPILGTDSKGRCLKLWMRGRSGSVGASRHEEGMGEKARGSLTFRDCSWLPLFWAGWTRPLSRTNMLALSRRILPKSSYLHCKYSVNSKAVVCTWSLSFVGWTLYSEDERSELWKKVPLKSK